MISFSNNHLKASERDALIEPMEEFVRNHIKGPNLGVLTDSVTYATADDAGKPSNVYQWSVELLRGSATSFQENAAAIERKNRELGRILGVEQLLLGTGSAGSYALSADKTRSFYLLVDGALLEVREAVAKDLLPRLWELNGWPVEMIPKLTTEAVRFTDVEAVAGALRDMATAGAILSPDDPVISEVRDLMGLSRPTTVLPLPATQDTGGNDE